MTTHTKDFSANRILALLPPPEAEVIVPHLELTEVQLGDIIDQPGKPIQYLYFPMGAAISITDMLDEHHIVEVTITGPEGCSGASIVQGSDQAVCMALVQNRGAGRSARGICAHVRTASSALSGRRLEKVQRSPASSCCGFRRLQPLSLPSTTSRPLVKSPLGSDGVGNVSFYDGVPRGSSRP